jgi:N-acetylmuramic acid 6-phosphate etherase
VSRALPGGGAPEVRHLATEEARDELRDIDLLPTRELVRLMNREDATVPAAVAAAEGQLAAAVDAVADRLAHGGRLIYVGAGTSGRLGLLDAAECAPTFDTAPGQVVGVLAGGQEAFVDAMEGAEDDTHGGRRAIEEQDVGWKDAVVGIAASGRTPFVLEAMRAARERGAVTVGVSCNLGATLSAEVEHAIEVETGPEVIAGSTRLKAGTAQKLILNTLSTVAMVRLGKTYGNLMVDVRATNDKLRERAARIVQEATGADAARARDALAASGSDVKVAILCLLAALEPEEAARRLEVSGGRLRQALDDAR